MSVFPERFFHDERTPGQCESNARPHGIIPIRFAVCTGDAWETNAQERTADGRTPHGWVPDWVEANKYASQAESQAVQWIADHLEGARDEGHDGRGDLIGKAWVNTDNPEQVALVREYRQDADTWWVLPEGFEEATLRGIPDEYACIFDLGVWFFGLPEEWREDN